MSLTVAILAGGLATRLGSAAEHVPKSLVDVGGRPFAFHQVELLQANGITDIVFLVGHMGEMIRDTVGDGARWGVRVRYSFDGPRRLGTGGAIRRAMPFLGDSFFVLYGDSYLEGNYAAIEAAFLASGKSGQMIRFSRVEPLSGTRWLHADAETKPNDKAKLPGPPRKTWAPEN